MKTHLISPFVLCAFLGLSTYSAFATTISVPTDELEILNALPRVGAGDTVLVSNRYSEDPDVAYTGRGLYRPSAAGATSSAPWRQG
jgi:hypothetical protein